MKKMPKQKVQQLIRDNPHLAEALKKIKKEFGKLPVFYEELSLDMLGQREYNIIYPVSSVLFVHAYKLIGDEPKYNVIEPKLTAQEEKLYEYILTKITQIAPKFYDKKKSHFQNLLTMAKETVKFQKQSAFQNFIDKYFTEETKPVISKKTFDKIMYFIKKNILGYSIIETLFDDPYIEDISGGMSGIFIVHKIFGNIKTEIRFETEDELDEYLFLLGDKMDKKVSMAEPIIEGATPDGSRIAILYGKDVSRRGSSFTLRKFEEHPLSIIDLVRENTMSSEEAAYFWLCLEHGMSGFICGETACGKTTTLRALTAFIRPNLKVYSVEETPEMYLPHPNWERTLTQEGRATMFDLLKAALRSRPNYIIVGEIRGREGNVAFQAMQTGHPVLSTFHASSIGRVIQRITGDPINVPLAFINNLNFVGIMRSVEKEGSFVRRFVSIHEIEGYYEEEGILTREVFTWDPETDRHLFRGLYNSYILEEKVATLRGLVEKRDIYKEMLFRKAVIDEMVKRNITGYHDVWEVIQKYMIKGKEGLPFFVEPGKWETI